MKQVIILSFTVFSFFNSLFLHAQLAPKEADYKALKALYDATNGDNWKNKSGWFSGNVSSSWYGITVSGGRVTKISLYDNQLKGNIPPEIGELVKLTELHLHTNQLSGNIPSSIGNLVELESLGISINQLKGSIPSSIGNLVKLENFRAFNNKLSGSIPSEIGELVKLSTLYLNDNKLEGSIPSSIGNLVELKDLSISTNQLKGSIPSSIGNLVKLEDFRAFNNKLSGSIPSEIKNLKNITYLSLINNKLTGNIPPEIGELVNLTNLRLHDNQLSGSIPSSIGNLVELKDLGISTNQLTGSIPPEIGELVNLTNLNLSNNQLSGSIPAQIGKLTNLDDLYLNHNQLTSLPPDIGKLTGIDVLYLNHNQLTTIPDEIGKISDLDFLYLNNNQLATIPDEIMNLSGLQTLDLSFNLLSTIPSTIQNLQNLTTLNLSSNQINNNSLLNNLLTISTLQNLDISFNQLSGNIPSQISKLVNLEELYLRGNQLSGHLPAGIGDLSNLQTLTLNDNQLTSIPSEINKLERLQTLELQNNLFTGSLPSLNKLSQLRTFYIQNNQFTGKMPSLTKGAIERIKITNNQFNDIADYSGYNLKIFQVANNQFDFADLIPNVSEYKISTDYSPQADVYEELTMTISYDDSLSMTAKVGGKGNIYHWYQNGKLLRKSENSVYKIDSATFDDNGLYYAEITNPKLDGLIIYRKNILVNVFKPSEILQADSLALVAFYEATDGKNWRNKWDLKKPIHTWYGITTIFGKITEINLHDNDLRGYIPSAIEQLDEVIIFDLSNNYLEKEIPTAIGNMTALQQIKLNDNQLQGSIPKSIDQLQFLKLLDLSDNELTGNVPDWWGMPLLRELNLESNQLKSLSNVLANPALFPALRKIRVQENHLKDLPNFSNAKIERLNVDENQLFFSDLLPNQAIQNFTYSAQAEIDNIDFITATWGEEVRLSVSDVGGTSYQWKLNNQPIGTASDQRNYDISAVNYQDAGEYTCEIKNGSLSQLTLYRKRIILRVLEPNVKATDAEVLIKLYENTQGDNWKNNQNWKNDQGNFDTLNIKNWYGITVVDDRVTEINLQNNNLNGTLPNGLSHLSKLTILDLSGNQNLKGAISHELGQLKKVKELDLSNSGFEGMIPPSLGEMEALEKLFLAHNNFTPNSHIPSELGNLIELKELNLSNNELAGSVPDKFTALKKLRKLNLSSNNLSELPNLQNLLELTELQVNNNLLTFKYLVPNRHVSTYIYAPQQGTSETEIVVHENGAASLKLEKHQVISSNQYQWKLAGKYNNQILSDSSTYTINQAKPQNTGDYECIVTNNLLYKLTLTFEYSVNVIPSIPKVTAPKPYCSADTLVTLISEGTQKANTNWYADAQLTNFLGKGEKLRLVVSEAQNTVYAIIRSGNNESAFVSIPIIRCPVIDLNGNQLKTDIGTGLTYQWQKDKKVIRGENTETLIIQGDGYYKVTVITKEGCSASSAVYQLQNGRLEQMSEETLLTSIEKEKNFQTSIYPNPFTERIEVRFDQNYGQKIQVQLMGIDGKIHFEKSMIGNAGFIIKAPKLAQGVYFLHLKMGDRKIVHKIIKK